MMSEPPLLIGGVMKCIYPISVHGMSVACGNCVGCRLARAEMWAIRLRHEWSYWKDASFLTLTYDEDHLPEGRTLVPGHMQLFWKRYRKDTGRMVKYFMCGEYGELNDRPHYHAVAFGIPATSSSRDEIDERWGMGRTSCTQLTQERIRYTAKYITKKVNGKLQLATYGERIPPFQRSSIGIGKRWLSDNNAKVERMLYITVNGRKVPIPRYYKDRLGITYEDYREILEDHDMAAFVAAQGIDLMEVSDRKEKIRRQLEAELSWHATNREKKRSVAK